MNIVIIGTGNTATVLGKKLMQGGHKILQIFGRNPLTAGNLAYELSSKSISDYKDIDLSADVFMIAVSDDAVEEVANQLHFRNQLLVHTAGSVSKHVLQHSSANFGVFYPLQSLRSGMTVLPEIPVGIDANTEAGLSLLENLAGTISQKVFRAGDDDRLRLHLAAVVVNNFVNHLYAMAENYCSQEKVSFDLLHPLIMETAARLRETKAFDAQTGPAVRRDQKSIDKHVQLLQQHHDLREIYSFFTRKIQEMHRQR